MLSASDIGNIDIKKNMKLKKIINFIPNIDLSIFKANQNDYHLKKNLITIMTRKNLDLASNIIKHLVYRLPKNWKIQIILLLQLWHTIYLLS